MNKISKYIGVICIFLLGNIHINASEVFGSFERPILIDCNTCFSDADFKIFARNQVPMNTAKYYVIANDSTEQQRFINAVWVNEPGEMGFMNIRRETILTITSLDKTSYTSYLYWKASGAAKTEDSHEYPPSSEGGFDSFSALVSGQGGTDMF
ncbi:MAG: hypothetical protein ACI9IA_000591 [Enterobacterales bacterium]|jgi:hypothetical protein